MYTGLKHLHSGFAYLLLAVLVISIIYVLVAYLNKKPFTEGIRKTALIGLIASHLQFLFGLILYFVSPLGLASISGEAMKNANLRLYVVEHPLTMLIAVALITVGYSKAKKLKEDNARFKKILLFYTLGLVLMLSRIPWSVWP